MRYITRLLFLLFLCTLAGQAQPKDNWTPLPCEEKGEHFLHLESVTRPTPDVVVFWSQWKHSNGAVYTFHNKLWKDRRLQFLDGRRGGKPLLGTSYPTPVSKSGKLDKIGETHHKFFFPK